VGGFDFNLRVPYEQGPLAAEMVSRILQWDGIDPDGLIEPICEKIRSLVCDGALDRDFRKWCASPEAPPALASFSRKWAELLFGSVALYIYAHASLQRNLSVIDFMPLWILDCQTPACEKHRALDRFVARFDDPVWKSIYPPNGWLCGCAVLAIAEEDLEYEPGNHRDADPRLIVQCASWLDQRPDDPF
jgi:hypothetical protein